MAQFQATVNYGGIPVRVSATDFTELHIAISGLAEVATDADALMAATNTTSVIPAHRVDKEGNAYFGFQTLDRSHNITFGNNKPNKGNPIIGFYPKGRDAVRNVAAMRQNSNNDDRQQRSPQQRPPQQAPQRAPQRPQQQDQAPPQREQRPPQQQQRQAPPPQNPVYEAPGFDNGFDQGY